MPIPPDLDILFPNGMVEGVLVYIWDGAKPIVWDGNISVSSTGSSIEDGASAAIKATVFDYTSSNPLAVRLTDTNGDYIGAGAGTQYTEDAAAAANPIGTALILVREDARAGGITTTDGDNIAARGNNKGELYTKDTDVATALAGTIAVSGPLTDTQLRATPVPVSAASLPLPTGAATEATLASILTSAQIIDNVVFGAGTEAAALRVTLPTDGTGKVGLNAGTNNIGDVDVLTVPTDPFGANADAASATGSISAKLRFIAGTGIPITGTVTVGAHAVTNAGTFAVQESGAALTALQLIDNIVSGSGVNVSQINGVTPLMGAGATGTGSHRVTAASDSPEVTSLAIIDDWDETDRCKVNPIAGQAGVQGASGVVTALTQRVVLATDVALPAGTNAIGKLAANSGVDIGDVDVTSLPAIPAGNNNIGDVDVASIAAGDNNIGNVDLASAIPAGTNLIGRTNIDPQTGNGLSIFKSLDLDESEEEVKGTAGAVYGYHFVNRTTSPLYLKFYNDTAANVIVGTTVPVMTLELPSNASDHIAGHIAFAFGIAFSTAITVAVTTGFADNDTGAPGTNAAIIHVWYK